VYLRSKLKRECVEGKFFYVISKQAIAWVFIPNKVTWFFPSNVYLCELTNRDISYTQRWDGCAWITFSQVSFLHHIAIYSFVFFFHSILHIWQSKRIYVYEMGVLLDVFFLFHSLGFFQAWVAIFVWVISFEYIIFFL